LRCYPECPREKIHVLPWGAWETGNDADRASDTRVDVAELRHEYGVPENAQVLLTLSRISPEKGQDLLLRALQEWESRPDFPQRPLWLFVCGDAAYMQGKRYAEHLKLLASRLRKTRVVFPGHVTGARKKAFFALADLYVFPSRHESYGLTLIEALGAGLPAVCLDHDGARSVMRPGFGRIVEQAEPAELRAAIAELLADDGLREKIGQAGQAYARTQRFSDAAARLAEILKG
jgi:glycosyltransferase involved in cell wall biosynthesis